MSKAVFFDIDGTLWDRHMNIPESTVKAIEELRENGVYTFICTGRAPAFLGSPKLKALPFDGIVAGCGTYVMFHGEELLCRYLEPELIQKTVEILRDHQMAALFEGTEYEYADTPLLKDDPYYPILKAEMGDHLKDLDECSMQWKANKFSATIHGGNYMEAIRMLEEWYLMIQHDDIVCEGVPKGFSKASGIEFICEKLGVAREDTYAFGDSANDREMLIYAGCGIAMGNGTDAAKSVADYVTDSLENDGIYNACRHFGLIQVL